MKRIIFILVILITTFSFAQNEKDNIINNTKEYYEKGKIIRIIGESSPLDVETDLEKKLKTIVEIKTGEFKGKKVIIDHPIFKETEYNTYYDEGDNVVIYISNTDGLYQYNIIDQDKRNKLIFLLLLFIAIVLIIGKKSGVKALLALLGTVSLIFYLVFPLLLKGYSPILVAVIFSVLASFLTIFFITGLNIKGKISLLGTSIGVIFAGFLSYIFVNWLGLSGYSSLESLYASNLFEGIAVKELVSAGIIIGSLGAIMDVAISISSSLNEIYQNNPNISKRDLFKSGMNIGRDIIGTMVNTLVLAYLGGSLFTILLFILSKQNFPLIRIFNFEFIATEILKSLAGSIGIVVSVPLTSYFGAMLYPEKSDKDIY
ncbi:MAG: YibE/F family protein [Fusobacteriota bacterium]